MSNATTQLENGTRAEDPRTRAQLSLEAVQQRLDRVVVECTDPREAINQFTLIAAEITGAEGGVFFDRDQAGRLNELARCEILSSIDSESAGACLTRVSQKACNQRRPNSGRIGSDKIVVAVPTIRSGTATGAIAIVLLLSDGDTEPFILALQLVSTYVAFWMQGQLNRRLDWEANATAAIVELTSEIQTTDTPKSAGLLTANKLHKFLGCSQVAIALCDRRDKTQLRLQTISGMAEFDPQSDTCRMIQAALGETMVRDSMTIWPPVTSRERHATLAHRRLAETQNTSRVVSSLLRATNGDLVGAWIFSTREDVASSSATIDMPAFVETAAPHVATSLDAVHRAQGSVLRRCVRWLGKNRRSRRIKSLIAMSILGTAILFAPMPHKIPSDCRLEPLMRRFAVAPYEGVLQDTMAKPGNIVSEDQVLARMDDREIQWELSGVVADRQRAAKKRDNSLSSHDIPAAQMAQLEVERLDLNIRLLRHQLDNLEIRSTVTGMVLSGDLDDAKGAPVKVGQELFEIAPLERLKLEIAVSEDELAYVREGLRVDVFLDGLPQERLCGDIESIAPQAEIRDGQNVFVAEVILENPDGLLRPGMQGRAKVVSDDRPIGWILFHRAWEQIREVMDI